MSKNLTIDEGGESRHFDGVRRLKTKLMGEDAGTCYWVPDDETQAWPTFIMNNGLHAAEDEGVYGFSEANVNVYIPTPNPDWKIIIDDIDIPHIIIEDIDIDIDDIDIHIDDIDISIDDIDGTPIVDIEGIDLDGIEIPNIDIHMDDDGLPTSDIDFKTDIHVWTDEDDPTKIHIKEEPNGEEIVLDYDDIDGTVTFKDLIDIRYDDTEDKWIIEASTKIKVDGVDYEAGDVIKSWDKDEIVDFTMKVEQEISVDFPDIDPDFGEDFDIELDLDNMELDMDGFDMDIDLPLLKMPDLDDELPDEIRIMHVPDKTSYKDGEAIDLDGIVVQAYKNGSVWQNKKYVNGYIPAHELDASSSGKRQESETDIFDDVKSICGNSISSASEVESERNWVCTNAASSYADSYNRKKIGKIRTVGGSDVLTVINTSNNNDDSGIRILIASPTGETAQDERLYYAECETFLDVVWSQKDKESQEKRYGPSPYHSTSAGTHEWTWTDTLDYRHNGKTAFYRLNILPIEDWKGIYIDKEVPDNFISLSRDDFVYEFSCSMAPLPYIPRSEKNGLYGKIAWLLLYGEQTGKKTIAISWPRPVDGEILSDSFDITIA